MTRLHFQFEKDHVGNSVDRLAWLRLAAGSQPKHHLHHGDGPHLPGRNDLFLHLCSPKLFPYRTSNNITLENNVFHLFSCLSPLNSMLPDNRSYAVFVFACPQHSWLRNLLLSNLLNKCIRPYVIWERTRSTAHMKAAHFKE